ncbi:dnaJ subfamily C member 11-like protein, partial [Leptotrombidium deliense]
LNRANQTYVFSVLLSDEIVPEAIFYGTIIPLLSYYCVKKFIIDPYAEREKEKKNQKARQENATRLSKLKKEAEAAIRLMTETYRRINEIESEKSGLVIVKALYGKSEIVANYVNCDEIEPSAEVINVSIPIQCLVKDSMLTLTEASKAFLPGFYDPCLGEKKE